MKKITLILLLFIGSMSYGQLYTVPTCLDVSSNTYGPMNSVAAANATNRTAVIYPASQLASLFGQELTAAYFDRGSASGTMGGSPQFKIYLKEVAATDWGSADLDWATAITGATLVYNSNPTAAVGSTAGWKQFSFSTNFTYSGTQNLAVFMEYTNPTASTTVTWKYEFDSPCINTANSNTTKYSNNTTGVLPASLNTSNYRRPYIGFDYLISCPAPTALAAANFTSSTVNLTWTAGGTETSWEYVIQPAASPAPTSGTVVGTNAVTAAPISPNTTYTAYVRAVCATDDSSSWTTLTFTMPPANDECSNAVNLTVNTDFNCGVTTPGTLAGATDSGVADTGAGVPDDDVWFSFVATATSHRITLANVTGLPTDLVHETMSGTCAGLTSVLVSDANTSNPTGLTIGATYYVRVFSFAAAGTPALTNFTVCVGTPPPAPANDNASGAIALTVNPTLTCTATTTGTTISATASADSTPSCNATGINDDVWYTFTATSTIHRITYTGVTTGTMATALYTGTPGSLTQLSGACQSSATQTFSGLTIGTVYYARVYTTVATATTQTDFTICLSTPPPPPANDDCAGAVALTVNADLNCGTVTAGTTLSATQSMAAGVCSGTPDDDVWFSFVATATSHVITLSGTVAVEGTSTDMYMQVLSGTCGSTASVQCSDPDSMTVTGLTAGNTYLVRVYSYGTTTRNTFNICVGTFPPAPANDNTSGAIALTVNPALSCAVTTNGTTISATASTEAAPSCNATGINDDVWYMFTATAADVRFAYTNVTTGTIATALYTGTPGALTQVANACQSGAAVEFFGLTVGTVYYVRVFTTAAAATTYTNFTVCLSIMPSAPANDLCANATPLIPGGTFAANAQVGTSVAATTTATGLTFTCQVNRILDVWYTVVVPASGSITIETDAVAGSVVTDTVLSVFTGTCGALTQIACSDDEGNGNFSMVSLTGLTPGATLIVGVWKYSANSAPGVGGDFQVSAYDASLAAPSFDRSNFKYYPNPVKDILKISYSETITNAVVYNLLGQQLMSQSINAADAQIDMTSLAAGTYVVKVMTVDGSTSMKIVKE